MQVEPETVVTCDNVAKASANAIADFKGRNIPQIQ